VAFIYRFGIKFCGGCNPTFERGQLFSKLKEATSQCINYKTIDEDDAHAYDGLLVICGCENCCVDIGFVQTKSDPIVIREEKDYKETLERLLDFSLE
jgi:hypothetical protein